MQRTFFGPEKEEKIEVGGYSYEEFASFMKEKFLPDEPDSFDDALGFLHGFLIEADKDPDQFLAEAGIQEVEEEEDPE